MAWPLAVWMLISTLVSVAVSSWLAPEVDDDQGGGLDVTKPDTNASEPVIYGEMGMVVGTIQHIATNDVDNDGVDNDLLHMIITWGESVSEIVDLWVDDKLATDEVWDVISTRYEEDEDGYIAATGQYVSGRWLYVYNMTNGVYRSWEGLEATGFNKNRHKFEGKAVSYVRAEWSRGKRFNGKPNVLAHIKGRRVWDPRNERKPWSDNPALCLLDYLTI